MNLTNAGKGSITLPLREGPDGALFPARVRRDGTLAPAVPCIVASSESIEIPSWYLDALLEEPGHAARIERGQIVITHEQPEPEQVSQPEPEQVSQPEPEQVSQPEPERRHRKRRG
jgi:hypothetical protein